MKYPKLRELKEAVISLFTPAYTSKFPAEPHVPFEKFRGKPVVDNDNCVGCETCANVCPPFAITNYDDVEKGVRIIKGITVSVYSADNVRITALQEKE